MEGAKYLAFDLGASSGRAILGEISDQKIKLTELHRFPNHMVNVHGQFYWDLLRLWEELKTGLTAASKNGHTNLKGIGVDTWGVDYGLLDEHDKLLANPVAYRDERTKGMLGKAFETVPREKFYELTGIQFMELNTAFQLLSQKLSDDVSLKNAKTLLFMPDLLNFLFSGEKNAEYSIASTSQLLNANTQQWESELFEKLGLPLSIMPEIVMPGTTVGVLTKAVQQETGLSEIPVISPASHDTGSAIAAVPCSGEDWAYLSSGTWSLMGIESEKPIISDLSLKNNFTNEGGVNGTIRFLKNIAGLWLIQECRRHWLTENPDLDFATIVELAIKADPFKCFIDPDDPSFSAPAHMPTAIAEYCKKTDQTVPESIGEFARCIFESLAMRYRSVANSLQEMRGKSLKVLHIVGGGCQNELLNQFTANATGLKVLAGPVEATALGNIMVQAMATGDISSLEEGRNMIKNSFPLKEFLPQNIENWNDAYEAFQKVTNA